MGETVDPPFPHDQRKPREHERECERERKRWKNRVCDGDDEDDENDDDNDDDGDDDYFQYYCTTNAHQLLQRVKFSRHRDPASPPVSQDCDKPACDQWLQQRFTPPQRPSDYLPPTLPTLPRAAGPRSQSVGAHSVLGERTVRWVPVVRRACTQTALAGQDSAKPQIHEQPDQTKTNPTQPNPRTNQLFPLSNKNKQSQSVDKSVYTSNKLAPPSKKERERDRPQSPPIGNHRLLV